MSLTDSIPFMGSSGAEEKVVEGLDGILGDGDAIALLPYDDGTFYMKRAYFDKELIGGMGGYETESGDKIAVDGDGTAVRELFGVPMLLGVDPTEHAAAVDPIKALVAHKDNIGEWIRVDREGQLVQVGPALRPAPSIVESEDVEAAFDNATDDELLQMVFADYNPEEYSAGEKAKLVGENEEKIKDAIWEVLREPEAIGEGGRIRNGNMVAEYINSTPQKISFDDAMAELAQKDDITKVYDIAPPAAPVQDSDGGVEVEEATHIAVDQSKAADLMPTTMDTVELNTALDKARMEEHEEGKLMKYFVYGGIAGAITVSVVGIGMIVVFSVSGGIF